MALVVAGEEPRIAGQGLEEVLLGSSGIGGFRAGRCWKRIVLLRLEGLDGTPVCEGHEGVARLCGSAAHLASYLGYRDAPVLHDTGQRLSQIGALFALHATHHGVAAQQNGGYAIDGAVAPGGFCQPKATGHAQEELFDADAQDARGQKMAAFMDKDQNR